MILKLRRKKPLLFKNPERTIVLLNVPSKCMRKKTCSKSNKTLSSLKMWM
jgi:hypothetical protein